MGLARAGEPQMRKLLKALKAFAQHPATQLITGLVLLISGGWEVVLDLMNAEQSFRLGVHHGVALFGLIQILGSLPEVVEGLNRSFEAIEKRQEKLAESGRDAPASPRTE